MSFVVCKWGGGDFETDHIPVEVAEFPTNEEAESYVAKEKLKPLFAIARMEKYDGPWIEEGVRAFLEKLVDLDIVDLITWHVFDRITYDAALDTEETEAALKILGLEQEE